MSNISEKIQNGAKNPIGIIGMFLVFVEAIASIVIINSSLNDNQNLILVLFIVLFPCAVLFVFYQLVTKHHEKLYSPSDYKDEKNFMKTYNVITQQDEVMKDVEGSIVSPPCQTGMSIEDVEFIKKSLLGVTDLQKKILAKQEELPVLEAGIESLEDSIGKFYSSWEECGELRVSVSNMYKCTQLVSVLKDKGYIVDTYRFFGEDAKYRKYKEHEAIWLGDEVPIEMATEVIKIAKEIFPHLKYIEINDAKDDAPEYVRYQIFVGGSTETAIERGLYEFTEQDFKTLLNMKSKLELHEYICGKNDGI